MGSIGQSERRREDILIYARKMAAKAARPAMAMELPTVLAAPVNGVIGAPVGLVEALREELAAVLILYIE
jgi:hypothetical protein